MLNETLLTLITIRHSILHHQFSILKCWYGCLFKFSSFYIFIFIINVLVVFQFYRMTVLFIVLNYDLEYVVKIWLYSVLFLWRYLCKTPGAGEAQVGCRHDCPRCRIVQVSLHIALCMWKIKNTKSECKPMCRFTIANAHLNTRSKHIFDPFRHGVPAWTSHWGLNFYSSKFCLTGALGLLMKEAYHTKARVLRGWRKRKS